jgi:glycosyltransferase involved in cell wall biosynthesis
LKVAVLNNDFRVYWKGRLHYLHRFLSTQNTDLYAVELFGKGSPYSFDTVSAEQHWWRCLFPEHSAADLTKQEIKKAIFAALDHLQPDVVIGPSIVFYAGALGIAWAKQNKKRFIMFDDAKPAQVKRNLIVQTVKDLITAQIDGLWLPSKIYDSAYAKFNNNSTLFFYGFSAIDNKLFKQHTPATYDKNVIICVARLVPIKNLNNLLRAWQKVEPENTGYQLKIVGDGPEEEQLKRLAAELALSSVEFVAAVSNNELPATLALADAFVLPSLSETWGLVVNEAMAAGLPVLLSNNVNAAGDLLKEGENGYGFDPYKVDEITTAILRYINLDKENKQRLSQQSLAIIDKMSYEQMGEQLLNAITVITAKPYNKPGLIAGLIINLWHGRYNTSGWDKL